MGKRIPTDIDADQLVREIQRRLQILDLTPVELARRAKLGRTAIYDILERRARHPRQDTIKKIATALGCTVSDLIGESRHDAGTHHTGMINGRTSALIELDVRAAAGAGAINELKEVRGEWRVPTDLFRAQTSAPMSSLRIISITGDSMEPELPAGTRVVVDTEDRVPSPPGVFIVWDGYGLVAKRVEIVPYSEPARITMKSDNERYAPYELPAADVKIQGRVIGRWRWM